MREQATPEVDERYAQLGSKVPKVWERRRFTDPSNKTDPTANVLQSKWAIEVDPGIDFQK